MPYFDTSFEDLVNLYIKTFKKISNKFGYTDDQILFFLHPRTTDQQRLKLINNLNGYCKINDFSSIVVENYLVQKNIHLI